MLGCENYTDTVVSYPSHRVNSENAAYDIPWRSWADTQIGNPKGLDSEDFQVVVDACEFIEPVTHHDRAVGVPKRGEVAFDEVLFRHRVSIRFTRPNRSTGNQRGRGAIYPNILIRLALWRTDSLLPVLRHHLRFAELHGVSDRCC